MSELGEIILLGAGASREAGVPLAYGMTQEIASKLRGEQHNLLRNEQRNPKHTQVLSFVIGGLIFQKGIRGDDPYQGVDVEELFNAVRLLADRAALEAAPFISSWHPMVDELDKVKQSEILANPDEIDLRRHLVYPPNKFFQSSFEDQLDRFIDKAVKNTIKNMANGSEDWIDTNGIGALIQEQLRSELNREVSNVETKIQDLIENQVMPGGGAIFREVADLMISSLASLVWLFEREKVGYLQPIVEYKEQSRLTIATLNYDNSIELAGRAAGIKVATGIEEWSQTGEFAPIDHGIQLLKLHGSIDWRLTPGYSDVQRPLPFEVIDLMPPEQMKKAGFQPAIVFGQRNKLTAKGPYLDLLRAFKRELDICTRLTVIGYSFRDDHVNEFISQWINGEPSRRLRVIDPGFYNSSQPFVKKLWNLGRNRLEVHQVNASVGIQMCFGQSKVAPLEQ